MKVIFAIPALTGSIKSVCHKSLVEAYRELTVRGIAFDEFQIENCPYLPAARNALVAMFMADAEATDLFFVDSDVGFDAAGVLRILERPEGIVAGIYPLKRDWMDWPVAIKHEHGVPVGRDGLIEAEFLPTGFMRIKRICFESLMRAYPELRYADSVVEVAGFKTRAAWDFFHMGIDGERQRWTTEDFAFCERWRAIGGRLWIYPNITFQHAGSKSYEGNYHEWLLQLPGGAKDPQKTRDVDIRRALTIQGWMTYSELEWLAEQASKRNNIVELGCYLGRSTRALADHTSGTVWAVDDWKGPRDVVFDDPQYKVPENLHEQFCANLKEQIASGKVMVHCADHSKFQQLYFGPDDRADMVFIDGSHEYEDVKRDIENALARLRPGGLLCGHDAGWPGVARALKELVPQAELIPGTSLWAYTVKEKQYERVPEVDGEGERIEHGLATASAQP